ncbi:MAG: peptidoglycan -binding protein [Alphaproteobacteria bacterium]|nr:peptidoglycan -binding protein [Alphaproteobacteria bacterium]
MPALSRRRSNQEGLNAWPGYVDALSTLLMVIIFVLLVFVLAQAFLSVALSGRDRALDRLNRQIAELSDMLSLERGRTGDMRASIAQLTRDLQSATAARDALVQQLGALRSSAEQAAADRDALKSERDKLAAQLADAQLQAQSAAARTQQLQARIAETADRSDAADQQSANLSVKLADAQRQLAAAQDQLKRMQAQIAELDRTVGADKDTIQARLSDLAKLNQQVQALTALRDELERQAEDAAARAATEQQRRAAVEAQLADERKFSDSARAQIALMTQQVEQLRTQLQAVAKALELTTKEGQNKDAQIVELGKKLNTALAAKVEELQRYRSEFFGRLREVLQNQPGIQVVGDRFVFQSEVLFPVGSAELTGSGADQINKLAATLKDIAAKIPADLAWVLRVDGHADKQPISGGTFASNWELSTQRAVNVVKLLIKDGVAPSHLAATGFADFQPLATGDTPEDYAKNRRIELRLTDR